MPLVSRLLLSTALSLSFVAPFATPSLAQQTSASALATDLAECGKGEATLKDALSRLVSRIVHERVGTSEMYSWSNDAWLASAMDSRIASMADSAVERVYAQTSTLKLAQSLGSSTVQGELITDVIRTMFADYGFRNSV